MAEVNTCGDCDRIDLWWCKVKGRCMHPKSARCGMVVRTSDTACDTKREEKKS